MSNVGLPCAWETWSYEESPKGCEDDKGDGAFLQSLHSSAWKKNKQKKAKGRSYQWIQAPEERVQRGCSHPLLSGTQWQDKKQWHKCRRFLLNARKPLFTVQGTENQNRLHRKVVESLSLQIFNICLDVFPWAGSEDQMTFDDIFPPHHSVIMSIRAAEFLKVLIFLYILLHQCEISELSYAFTWVHLLETSALKEKKWLPYSNEELVL